MDRRIRHSLQAPPSCRTPAPPPPPPPPLLERHDPAHGLDWFASIPAMLTGLTVHEPPERCCVNRCCCLRGCGMRQLEGFSICRTAASARGDPLLRIGTGPILIERGLRSLAVLLRPPLRDTAAATPLARERLCRSDNRHLGPAVLKPLHPRGLWPPGGLAVRRLPDPSD